jgi:hypothetical protein
MDKEKKVRSAEEILNDVFLPNTIEIPHSQTLHKMVLAAMEEYASQLTPSSREEELTMAKIEVLESLYDRGLKDSHQTLTTGKRLYDDVINPMIKELRDTIQKQ